MKLTTKLILFSTKSNKLLLNYYQIALFLLGQEVGQDLNIIKSIIYIVIILE